jgi:histone demethylase JARID1
MLLQAKEIPVQLPTVQVICDMLDRAEEWSKEAQLIQDSDTTPHFDQLKSMLASGRPIPVKLELLAQLESRFAAAKGWVDRAARTFLKKTSNNSVLEVRY